MRAPFLVVAIALCAVASCDYVILPPVLGYEADDEACVDLLDNDVDGAVDCEDPDCWVYSNRCGEVPTEDFDFDAEDDFEECTDGLDNDAQKAVFR